MKTFPVLVASGLTALVLGAGVAMSDDVIIGKPGVKTASASELVLSDGAQSGTYIVPGQAHDDARKNRRK